MYCILWCSFSQSLGMVGKVVKIDSDGDVAVAFGNQAWVYNPGLLIPANGRKVDVLDDDDEEENEPEDPSGSRGTRLYITESSRLFWIY